MARERPSVIHFDRWYELAPPLTPTVLRRLLAPSLAIFSDAPGLEATYRSRVIAGAFALAADGFEDSAEVLRCKPAREIEYRPKISRLAPR